MQRQPRLCTSYFGCKVSTACPTLCRGHVWKDYRSIYDGVCSQVSNERHCWDMCGARWPVFASLLCALLVVWILKSYLTYLPQFLPLWVEIVRTDLAELKGKCLEQCLGIWWGNSNIRCFPLLIWWGSQSVGTIDKRTLKPCVLSGRKLLGLLIRLIHKRNTSIGWDILERKE